MANEQDENRLDSDAMDKEDRNVRSCCAGSSYSGGGFFQIHVRGHLDSKWSDWLEGLEVKLLDNGEMFLSGTIVDQAALMGVLNKLNRLNLTLLSVSQVNQPERH
jgi:hypothetical protein